MIVRSYRNTFSECKGLNFSPSSNILVRASKAQPQIIFYDIAGNYYSENFALITGELADYHFAPEGHNLAVCSRSPNEFAMTTFIYTENDIIDEEIRVEYPVINITKVDAGEKFIDTENPHLITSSFCNQGNVPFLLNKAELKQKKHFILEAFQIPDTLFPGECLQIPIVFNPKDTGTVKDTISLTTCFQEFQIELVGYGKARNIQFLMDVIDAGETCVNQKQVFKVKLFKNLDPVPLRINEIEFFDFSSRPFYLYQAIKDTIIPAYAEYETEIVFNPNQIGENIKTCKVFHSNALYLTKEIQIKGIGLDLKYSNTELLFAKGVFKRTLEIENLQNKEFTITGIVFDNDANYKLNTNLPLTLTAKGKIQLEVEYLGDTPLPGKMQIFAFPCVTNSSIKLGEFSGISELTIKDTEADPSGEASIFINYKNTQKYQYNGKRYFEGEISINPRIFIPFGDNPIITPTGTGELISNEIIDDKRVIKFRLFGEYETEGSLVEIKGLAGLAETKESDIEFTQSSAFWGSSAVTTTSNKAKFRLINLCGDRLLVQNKQDMTLKSITPNPVSDVFSIEVNSKEELKCNIEIYNELSNLVSLTKDILIHKGDNKINLNAAFLNAGKYHIVIKSDTNIIVGSFIVIK